MTWWMRLGAAEMRRHPLRTVLVGALIFVPVTAMVVASVLVASATQRLNDEFIRVVTSDGCGPSVVPGAASGRECDLEALAAAERGVRHRTGSVGTAFVAGRDGRAIGIELLELPDPAVIFGPNSRVLHGRLPAGPGEVALAPGQLSDLGAKVGDTVRFGMPEGRARVVGEVVVEDARVGFVAPGTLSATAPEADPTGAAHRTPVAFVVVDDHAMPEATHVEKPLYPPRTLVTYGVPPGVGDDDPLGFVPLVGGAALIWLALVASTGLAVGARRRRRELGLLIASGADPGQLRLAATAEGVVLGLVGAGLGLVVGLVGASIGTPWFLRRFGYVAEATVVPWGMVLVCAVLGVAAAAVAGDLATRALRHQTPVELLAEASLTPRPARRWFAGGAVLWALALGGLALDRRPNFISYDMEWSVRIVIGILSAGGLVALVVGSIQLVGRATRALPQAWHLAGADLTRHGARVGAAAAAVSLTLAGSVGAAVALTHPQPGPDGGDGAYGPVVVPLSRLELRQGRLVQSTRVGVERVAEELQDLGVDSVDLTEVPCPLPVCDVTSLAVPSSPAAQGRLPSSASAPLERGLMVLPGHLEDFFEDPTELFGIGFRPTATPGVVQLSVGAQVVTAALDRDWRGPALLPQALVGQLGLRAAGERSLTLDAVRSHQVEEVNRVLTAHGVDPLWDPVEADERDRAIAFGLMLVAGAVALVVAVLALALVRAESVEEDRSLAALGAGGLRRRSVHAARGALCVFAAAVPALVGAALLAKVRMGASGLGIPLWSVLLVGVGLPFGAWALNLVIARPRRWDPRPTG